ncbi:conserved phage C-terminal domain-containing protein [uncultured Anaerococcus sp.]|uniref:conserved phage C-terminal domain-containing protein n=1 Tax=uncultured Anaerococcus sp. TaxID=293428 RepID=UPI00288B675F|nr:conserved phage C-terminal domain-containing protein [uncultured Anaerococcus sp.]
MYDDKQKSNTKNEEINQEIEPYAKLPIRILSDKNLTDKQKLIFGSILTLSSKSGVCFASNSYLAKIHACKERTIIRAINELENKSYVTRKLIYSDDRKRVIKRELRINYFNTDNRDTRVLSRETGGTVSRVQKCTVSNVTDNITSINTINNNNIYCRADGKNEEIIICVINYLNEKADKNYKSTTQKTKSLINARIKEGFTLDDFKKVIDTKTQQWKLSADMNRYLRPETLFGNKFESYLQEKNIDNRASNNASNRFADEDKNVIKI